ncbi:hypothetical protein CYMTET_47081 [Cymbomonas tetramitiformis]|uniref:Uncharacterized protein n=1 Tax=Cymbomonas tetramitiformis TaxID=36881 RepID=A0AAE0BV06_9CHLO|nr:hypothetical protein CYMTET_47081 [Cymbomonas tetramitiformis]
MAFSAGTVTSEVDIQEISAGSVVVDSVTYFAPTATSTADVFNATLATSPESIFSEFEDSYGDITVTNITIAIAVAEILDVSTDSVSITNMAGTTPADADVAYESLEVTFDVAVGNLEAEEQAEVLSEALKDGSLDTLLNESASFPLAPTVQVIHVPQWPEVEIWHHVPPPPPPPLPMGPPDSPSPPRWWRISTMEIVALLVGVFGVAVPLLIGYVMWKLGGKHFGCGQEDKAVCMDLELSTALFTPPPPETTRKSFFHSIATAGRTSRVSTGRLLAGGQRSSGHLESADLQVRDNAGVCQASPNAGGLESGRGDPDVRSLENRLESQVAASSLESRWGDMPSSVAKLVTANPIANLEQPVKAGTSLPLTKMKPKPPLSSHEARALRVVRDNPLLTMYKGLDEQKKLELLHDVYAAPCNEWSADDFKDADVSNPFFEENSPCKEASDVHRSNPVFGEEYSSWTGSDGVDFWSGRFPEEDDSAFDMSNPLSGDETVVDHLGESEHLERMS